MLVYAHGCVRYLLCEPSTDCCERERVDLCDPKSLPRVLHVHVCSDLQAEPHATRTDPDRQHS